MRNNNNNNLAPSLSQGQVFRNQQKSRILNNNDVVTGNTIRNRNKIKNDKTNGMSTKSATTIEPFSLNADINNYNQFSNEDIASDDSKIKLTNDRQKAQTQQSIKDYSNSSSALNRFQQGVTDEAMAYNNINKDPRLLNKNYLTADNKTIRVNNAGVINTLTSAGEEKLDTTSGINISKSIADPPLGVNYIPVENIPAGFTTGFDAGLYGTQSANLVSLPTGVSAYKLEGENVFVAYPYPNSPADINKNMVYHGAFTKEDMTGLSLDSAMPTETTLNCLQRAVDKGYSWCGMTQYDNAQGGGGGGKCMIGTPNSLLSRAYKLITISQSDYRTSVLKFPTGYTTLTFGADGVLYAGHDNYKFALPLTTKFSHKLDPTYGGAINSFVGSYGLNQGSWNWQNLANFSGSGNSDPTGKPSARFETSYEYDEQVSHEEHYTYYYYDPIIGQLQSYSIPYTRYTTKKRRQLLAPNTAGGNITHIDYNCGKFPTDKPTYIGDQYGGSTYSITCENLYNEYPSFTLELSDTGILTITNNASAADSKKVTYNMLFKYETATLSNGQEVKLNMPRDDWVKGSKNGEQPLKAESMIIHSITQGQWISSPNGYCRLILTRDNGLQLEYSLQDVSKDKDGNLVGSNSSSVAVYEIKNVNSSNLGATAHIDINGAVNPYPSPITAYDNKYTEMKGYIPKPGSGNVTANLNDSQCRIACNNDPTCAGYVVYSGSCNRLTAAEIFPTGGDRIPGPANTTYIRNPMFPQNDKSCRKTLDAVIDSNVYSYYIDNKITPKPLTPMTTATKCNLGKVLDRQMKELEMRNSAAIQTGDLIKGQFQDLFSRENRVLDSISKNREYSKKHDENTKKTTDKIQSIKNAQITKSAVEKDSDLLLISDNYRYVTWGIVSLLLSIAAIKGLRAASD
jgi:hypothetical protein